jgi:deoxycytidylate deaminase
MRPAAFFLSAIVLLAAAITQHGHLRSTQATGSPSFNTHCAREGAAVQGACSPDSLDSTPALILSHTVLAGACPGADLHLVRYQRHGSGGDSLPFAARWCN